MKPGCTICPSCFEVNYKPPSDKEREAKITGFVLKKGGRVDYWESPPITEIASK
jgi:hypothetical protein